MARQNIYTGAAPNDGTGDTLRNAFTKVNENFIENYASISSLTIGLNDINASVTALGVATNTNITALGTTLNAQILSTNSNITALSIATNSSIANTNANVATLNATVNNIIEELGGTVNGNVLDIDADCGSSVSVYTLYDPRFDGGSVATVFGVYNPSLDGGSSFNKVYSASYIDGGSSAQI